MAEALRIALLGAESTGKTTLAQTLALRLAQQTGRRVAWVPEWLRAWCDTHGRVPQAHEQALIAEQQHAHIEAAAATHDIVLCDTTALMTAVYGRCVFGDASLDARAHDLHGAIDLSLVMALDLPWVADGIQRSGAHVRATVDAQLRAALMAQPGAWAVVGGVGPARVERALAALAPWLRKLGAPRGGLFTGLAERATPPARTPWRCDCCDVPELEQALRRSKPSTRRGLS